MKKLLVLSTVLASTLNIQAQQLPQLPPAPAPHYVYYRAAAVYLSDEVTSSVDALKGFRQNFNNHDLGTSEGLRQEYRARQAMVQESIQRGQQLFTTATEVLRLSHHELEAAEGLHRFGN